MPLLVSICIATYKRPELLGNLIGCLNQLTFEKNLTPNIEVIIADNDLQETARSICERAQSSFRWTLKYDVEPQKGVSYARNRSVANAAPASSFIVFIDDDEVPCPTWLDELLYCQTEYKADVVAGPVYPEFQDESVPEWVSKGGFFDPPKHQTGDYLNAAFTNNVLVRVDLIRQLDVVFDPRFAFKGAEDTYLFMRLRKMGAKIVWTNKAIVYESIPPTRTTLKWLIDRGFWGWSSYSLFEKELFPSFSLQTIRFVKGLSLIGLGLLASFPTFLMGRHRFYNSLLKICQGFGTVSGLLGFQGDW